MDSDRRSLLLAGIAAIALGGRAAVADAAGNVFRPEAFGAKGDGVTNDTRAFAALSQAVNLAGGGRIVLSRRIYIVGRQMYGPEGAQPSEAPRILDLRNLHVPLSIEGNGAILRCAPGLRYGTFDPSTGAPRHRPMPNYVRGDVASPYVAMISIRGASAPITILDLELDGNLPRLAIGGGWGDTGYQIACIGLTLADNRASETIVNLHVHHHGQDGVEINGDPGRRDRSRFDRLVSDYNGRQGVSIIGGRGYDFIASKFNKTGRSVVQSGPGAGVDIEAENGRLNRDFTFTDCEFVDNWGCGVVADSGDSAQARFTRCLFIGTSSWSAWPGRPYFRFDDCTFVGALSNACGSPDPAQATQFYRCLFTDDPARARGGRPYLHFKTQGAIVDLSDRRNILFDHCTFRAIGDGQLPWSTAALYRDCVMSQTSRKQAYPRGTYLGHNQIRGNVDLHGSEIPGEIMLNGNRVANTHHFGLA